VVDCGMYQRAIIDADALCVSVSAASIVAKVARDAVMTRLEDEFPGYGFAENKGYSTPGHKSALRALGPTTLHRQTWAPVREAAALHR
jgi:ribonuclease HII